MKNEVIKWNSNRGHKLFRQLPPDVQARMLGIRVPPPPKAHTVTKKDSLDSVAQKYDLSVPQLLDMNPQVNQLAPGMVLNIRPPDPIPVADTAGNEFVDRALQRVGLPVIYYEREGLPPTIWGNPSANPTLWEKIGRSTMRSFPWLGATINAVGEFFDDD